MAGAAHHHFAPMVEKGPKEALQPHHPRRAGAVQHVHVHREAGLEVAEPEEALHQHLGLDGAGAGLQHQPDLLGRLVAHVGQQGGLLLLDELGELLDELGLLHLVGDLGDHDAVGPPPGVLLLPTGAHPHPAAPGLIGLQQRGLGFHDHPAGGEVGAGHPLHQVGGGRLGPLQQHQAGVEQLQHVVRRDRGGHADRDPGGAVGEQVGKGRRQDHRLLVLAVVGGPKVDRVLVDPVEQKLGGGRQLALGVAHGGGVIAVDVAEIALAVDQRVALGEVLGQPNHGVIDRLVPVRMEPADHVPHHPGALLGRACGVEPHLAHRIEHAPLAGLQPVAHVRQRPVGDGRQGVGQVAPRQGLRQRLVDDAAAVVGTGRRRKERLGHPPPLAESEARRGAAGRRGDGA